MPGPRSFTHGRIAALVLLVVMPIAAAPALSDDADSDGTFTPEDCNDGMASAEPGDPERCDGFDNDCDGIVDEGCAATCPSPYVSRTTHLGSSTSDLSSPVLTGWAFGLAAAWLETDAEGASIRYRALDRWGIPRDDPVGLGLGSAAGGPAMTTSGDWQGIAWIDDRDGRSQVYFSRLEDGTLSGPVERPVTTGTASKADPAVAWNGEGWAVAWVEGRQSFAVNVARLLASGMVVGDATVSSKADAVRAVSIASDADGYGVVWEDDRAGVPGVYFRALDGVLLPTTDELRVDAGVGEATSPRIVWSGTAWIVAWVRGAIPGAEVVARALDPAGQPLGPAQSLGSASGTVGRPSLVALGDEVAALWLDGPSGAVEAHVARLDATGALIESGRPAAGPAALSGPPGVATTGDGLRTVWLDATLRVAVHQLMCCGDRDGDGHDRCEGDCADGDPSVHPGAVETCNAIDDDCDGDLDDADGGCPRACFGLDTLADPVASRDGSFERAWDVSAAWDGDTFGVVWAQEASVGTYVNSIGFRRFDADGNALADPVRLMGPPDSDPNDPVITAAKDGWALAWFDRDPSYGPRFRLLAPDGTPLGPPAAISTSLGDADTLALARADDGFGLVWEFSGSSQQVGFARFSDEAVPIGATRYLYGDAPDLAWTGSEYLIVVEAGPGEPAGIWLERLDAQGGPAAERRRIVGSSLGGSYEPDIAWMGDGFGLVFIGNHQTLYFTRCASDGTPIVSRAVVTRSYMFRPEIVWTGESFVVQFVDDDRETVEVVRLTRDGSLLGSPTVLSDGLPGSAWAWDRTGIAVGANGRMLSAFHRSYDPEAAIWSRRLGCCAAADGDLDRSCLDDCDASDGTVWPGAPEVCDGLDNDCDGTVPSDEGPFEPVRGLVFVDTASFEWSAAGGTDVRYDVQRGDLHALTSTAGNYSTSTERCLVANGTEPSATDADRPLAHEGFWYLAGAGSERCNGTFRSGESGERGDRDGGIAGASAVCP